MPASAVSRVGACESFVPLERSLGIPDAGIRSRCARGQRPHMQTGWSVVARGRLHVVAYPAENSAIRLGKDPQPWAGGTRRLYVKLPWRELTGRRLEPLWLPSGRLRWRESADEAGARVGVASPTWASADRWP